ncbi:unnamed protein product [Diabrotica balteata]|uniref:C2H2-type domain-containing protein n=1 Tax=Diabrotica balteata TaxID=107213 RepID=A0A9N9SN29_DIABA|nr:unnamed protein product [Diabrotica balteata]
MFQTPKRNKLRTREDSGIKLTPDDRILKVKCPNSVDKGSALAETRRGRPNADLLNTLILEGSTSPSSIKCKYCGRVFPREKSLQAHLRTHTGERPYRCDYPRCTRKFAQSGQLKTHQRLHTGEKPFICAAPNCTKTFTHANRHCQDHPDYSLKRLNAKPEPNLNKKYDETHNAEVKEWLLQWDKRNTSSSAKENFDTTPKKSMFQQDDSACCLERSSFFSSSSKSSLMDDIENSPKSDTEYSFNASSLGQELHSSPKRTPSELPKKRWLREAVQNQNLWESTIDLASPINWGDETYPEPERRCETAHTFNEKQDRPSVLVCVQGGKSKEISSDEIEGAMALVELKNSINYRI